MKSRMLWKLTACFAIILLLFTSVLGAIFLYLFREHTITLNRTSMEEKAQTIATTLASFENKEHGSGENGKGGYGAYIRFLKDIALADVWIVDEQMNLLTAGHRQSAPLYNELPDNAEQIVMRVFQGEVTYGQEFSSLLNTPTLTVGAPICANGIVTGAVLLHSPVSGVNEALMQGTSALCTGLLIALFFSSAAAFLLSYRFTTPLFQMRAAAERLADGDYTAKTGVAQSDEIGQLAHTMDLLANRLSLAEQERKSIDQMKEDFVANVSHELRTPVAVLRGSLEMLLDHTISSQEEITGYYNHMLAESRHLERLVNDLLDLSRLQDAQFRQEMNEVNLNDIVKDSNRSIRRAASEKKIILSTECPDDACMILGDYGRIRQMLLILLDNAVKFSKEEGKIELTLTICQNDYRLSVTDYGAGIPAKELPFIFERFYKTTGPENPGGTGLGLSIAQQIAMRHSTKILAESTPGRTCFSILFKSQPLNET